MKFQKLNIPHNKGKEDPKKLKKLEKLKLGLPIFCKRHGEHLKWRMHSSNNVQCKECAFDSAKKRRKRDPLKFIFQYAKKHSKISNREFTIKLNDLYKLMKKQNKKCALTGVTFDENNIPSLDRIDSNIGYNKENIQLLLIKINRMKSNIDQQEFINLCKLISNHEEIKEPHESLREEVPIEAHQERRQRVSQSNQRRCEVEEPNIKIQNGEKEMKKEKESPKAHKKHEAKESKAYEKKEDRKEAKKIKK